MAELLRRNLRLVDIPFRYGGEEFVILVPTVRDQSALGMEIAERLRGAVERHDFECFGGASTLKKTVSIGVSCFPMHGSTAHEVIRAADKAMYLAKTTGRNRVCAAVPP
jgi:diguanylate cyclase (GGDEF)-like protein